ncbi:MAG TPA: 2-oxoacid:acceptor oxidoreductase subunit alpha [Candidatus Binataceae bacterium]|nr:2-oxoacid:acceptor oxidoreductase subunit alpha [Candidatus Binataceae bacterium]
MTTGAVPMQGNQACALAAVAAGCRFFAGYPITPSSEIAEHMSRELPKVGGVFVQMEDEIGSLAAVIGASMGGAKAMTATSGPGFSLMQENLGFASATEVPCVIIDVMRGGPSTGMPTRPSQGDLMQARWGTHGDHPIIALAPASVAEIYEETIRAFNLAEQFRVPVVVLYDQVIAHLLESVEVRDVPVVNRTFANGSAAQVDNGVAPMVRPGDGHRLHTTGLTHSADGFPTQDPETVDRMMRRLLAKIESNRDAIEKAELFGTDDAEIVIVACGIVARAARRAVSMLREEGIPVAMLRPVTLWPFPEKALMKSVASAQCVLVPEMNAGQMVLEIERMVGSRARIESLTRIDGEAISPSQIVSRVRELARNE